MGILFIVNLCFLLVTHNAVGDDLCKVKVEQGILEGQSLDLVTGEGKYCSFKGVPYAESPIGDLRFKAPVKASPWEGVRNAIEHGPVCPQKDILTNVYIPGNEDCLFLNVYSPNLKPATPHAVLFYIHGGGFKCGSGNADALGPDFFLRKDFNIVVVTINYRLDVLGFLSTGTKDVPGNAGLKDQVMALKWVNENIKYFGGDPYKVTIMGESAGSASCALHMSSPMSAGLFHRVIALSGSPFNDWVMAYKPVLRALKLGKNLGFETRDVDELLSFLKRIPSERLVNYRNPNILASEESTAGVNKQYQFSPVIEYNRGEGNFLTENLYKKHFGYVNKADILFGYTDQEGVTVVDIIEKDLMPQYDSFIENFAPRKVTELFGPDEVLYVGARVRDYYFGNKSIDTEAMKDFVNYISEANFKYDIIKYYSQFPNYGTKYMYQFSGVSSRNLLGVAGAEYNISGAGHAEDLFYLFDPKILNLPLDLDSKEFEIIERFTKVIKNFVHHGNPTPDLSFNIVWPEFDITNKLYMDIGNHNLTLLSLNDRRYLKFWSQLLESVGVIY